MVRGNHPRLLLSDKLLKLIPDETVVDRSYLVRALRSAAAVAHFSARAGGSSGSMTNITQSDIREAPILLPKLAEQCRIAAILDQAEALRIKRRVSVALADSLAQAIFIQMFGDPISNPHGLPRRRLTQVCHCYSGGTPSKSNSVFWAGALPWFSAKDMKAPDLFDSEDHICEDVPASTSLKLLPKDTVAIVVRGMILAHTFPVSVLRVPATINQDLKALLPVEPIEVQFLANCLRAQAGYVLGLVSEAGHGTKRLDSEALGQIHVLCPPIEKQREFVARVNAVGSLQAAHRASLTHLEALFASLQHRAFRGELFA